VRGGLSVRDALKMRSLERARVVAGERGLDRQIRSVNVMEVPDILPYVKEHELLLTTAYPIRDDPTVLERLLPELAKRDLAAVAVVPRAFLRELPPGAVTRADELDLPLLELPERASFNEIMAEVFARLLDERAEPDRYEADESGIDRLMRHLRTDVELRRFCDEIIGPLIEHDRRRGGDLTRTLEVYLRNEGSGVATARELGVHYNTLRYRLRRIEDLVGLDRGPGSRVAIEIALRALRVLA
jgi:hypothetical protein